MRRSRGYVSQSFGAFFADKSWLARALVGTVVWNIPILGPIAIAGYALEWIHQTAWGTGDLMPRRPRVGETLLWGLRAVFAQAVWMILGLMPLLTGWLIGGGMLFSGLMPGSDLRIGTQLRFGAASIAAEIFGALIIAIGVALFVAFMLLALVGFARMAVHRRLSAALPLSGQTAFVLSHKLSFARAMATSILASIPALIVYVAINETPAELSLTATNAIHWGLHLPFGFASFCAAMISARALGCLMRDADPRSNVEAA